MKKLSLFLFFLFFLCKPLFTGEKIYDKILFVVDNKPFLLSDFLDYLSLKEMKKITVPVGSYSSLKDFIDFILLSEDASSRGYTVDEVQLENDIKSVAISAGLTEEGLKNYIENTLGISYSKFRELRKRFILSNMLVGPSISKAQPSEDEILSYYRQHIKNFSFPMVKVVWITTSQKVKLKHVGADKISSVFPEAQTEVVEVREGYFKKEMEERIFSAKKGNLIGPFKSGEFYSYFYILEGRKVKPIPLENVRSKIGKILLEQKREEIIKNMVEEAKDNHFLLKCFTVKNDKVNYYQRGSCRHRP